MQQRQQRVRSTQYDSVIPGSSPQTCSFEALGFAALSKAKRCGNLTGAQPLKSGAPGRRWNHAHLVALIFAIRMAQFLPQTELFCRIYDQHREKLTPAPDSKNPQIKIIFRPEARIRLIKPPD